MKEFDVVLERDEDGWFIADVPALPGCHTQGETKRDVLRNVKEAIELYLEVLRETGTSRKQGFVGIEKVKVYA
ncbi:MAG: type II toxin-antitoxin system HicB family antitoxin [Candidatus Diapherotrites archaeon]|nr:type II toxin-antitoxin system HicB family antitoxin [Candidatus Diapherotrites archaeon]